VSNSPPLKKHWKDIPGCYLSAFVSPKTDAKVQHLIHPQDIEDYENKIEKHLAIIMIFLAWGESSSLTVFPEEWCEQIRVHGSVPHITWEPWDFDMQCKHYRNQIIVSGKWDAYIRSWAVNIKAWGYPIFLRWGHEMNSDWYPWGGKISEGGEAAYVQAYRHIVDLFREEGVDNVIWIWSPDVANFAPQTHPFDCVPYYPGDDYVDWIGFDGYNFALDGSMKKPWTSFKDLFKEIYDRCSQLNEKAPFMVAEFASGEMGGNKAEWIQAAFTDIEADFPRIRAVTWFDQQKESAWPVDSSPEVLKSFREAIKGPYFLDRV